VNIDKNQILTVISIVNNNIVIAKDFNGREMIVIGKGLGFRKKKNSLVYPDEFIKSYILVDKPKGGVFTLFEEVPFNIIETSQQIIDYAGEQLKMKFNVNLLIALADHINFSIIQYLKGNNTPKLISEEVRRFYKNEYQIGLYAIKLIEKNHKVKLPDDEATSIAFHLITASENESNDYTRVLMQSVSDIVKIVENALNTKLDDETLVYSRFIIHLKFFLRSVITHQTNSRSTELVSIFKQLKTQYENVEKCVSVIAAYVKEKFDYNCSDEDCIYLMMHIVRLYETK
jgi:Transcriptional antiterminator